MSIFKALTTGFKLTWKYKRIVVLLYMLTFVLSACIAFPLKNLIEVTVGKSLMIKDLVKGVDYQFFNDFNNTYGLGLIPVFDQSITVLMLFFLLFVFFSGGVISVFINDHPESYKKFFWRKGAHFFFRFCRLAFYFSIIHLSLLGMFFLVFYLSINGEMQNEGTISFALKVISPFYYLAAVLIFMWQDYSKVFLVKSDKTWIFQSMFPALKFIKSNFLKVYGLYLLNMLFWFVLIYLNFRITLLIKFTSGSAILLAFLISQVFVLSRLSLKLINLGSVVDLYSQK